MNKELPSLPNVANGLDNTRDNLYSIIKCLCEIDRRLTTNSLVVDEPTEKASYILDEVSTIQNMSATALSLSKHIYEILGVFSNEEKSRP